MEDFANFLGYLSDGSLSVGLVVNLNLISVEKVAAKPTSKLGQISGNKHE